MHTHTQCEGLDASVELGEKETVYVKAGQGSEI